MRHFTFIYHDESFYDTVEVYDLVCFYIDPEDFGNTYEAYTLAVL